MPGQSTKHADEDSFRARISHQNSSDRDALGVDVVHILCVLF